MKNENSIIIITERDNRVSEIKYYFLKRERRRNSRFGCGPDVGFHTQKK